jgi:hypothetical protein
MRATAAATGPGSLRSSFKRQGDRSLATNTERAQGPSTSHALSSPSPPSSSVFWAGHYLALGQNTHVVGDLFQANTKNSISQHGRDLSVRLKREIDKGPNARLWLTAVKEPLAFVVHRLGDITLKDVRAWFFAKLRRLC